MNTSIPPVAAPCDFPDITIPGVPVNPKECVEPGTAGALVGAYILGVFMLLFLSVVTYGVALIGLVISPMINWYVHRKAIALLHGSGIKVSESQFPEIHACVSTLAGRLGLAQSPDVYIVEANVLNAAAIKYGKKNVLLLTDDLIHGCIHSTDPRALAFVIGHELGHIALKHNSPFRLFVANYYKKLSRLNEYTVDRIGLALVGDRQIAFNGLLLLTAGYHLMPYVNADAIRQQAQEVLQNKYSTKAERPLSHPLLLKRMERMIVG